MAPTLKYERELWAKGEEIVCGIDEVGRGSWAGPLYVGAVVFDKNCKQIRGVNDSKALTARQREKFYKEIKKRARAYATGRAEHHEIDAFGMTAATNLAIKRAVEALGIQADMLLIDAFSFDDMECMAVKGGDKVCYSISCASILAKVERDKYISEVPEATLYKFDKNKGYGTKEHLELIKKHGLSGIHRKSFKPIKDSLKNYKPQVTSYRND